MIDIMTKEMNSEAVTLKILKVSSSLLAAFTIVTIIVGLLASAQTILAEGISGLSAVITTLISIAVVKFIAKRNARKYPFGKEGLEPLIGIVNYCLMIFICVAIIADAVQMILAGGNHEIHVIPSILFGFFYVIFNMGGYGYLKSQMKDHATAIAELELVGWKFSVFTGIGMAVGFSLSWVLDMTPLSVFTPYIDPIMSIILMLLFVSTPLFEMKNCIKELMQARPSEEITSLIAATVKKINYGYVFSDKVLRLGKVGSKIRIEIDYVIEKGSTLDSISEQDRLRSQLTQAFAELPYGKWINVNFTSDIKWTERAS
jgi:predicted Co/Zn/Cd cation transporter (cation efflux family)